VKVAMQAATATDAYKHHDANHHLSLHPTRVSAVVTLICSHDIGLFLCREFAHLTRKPHILKTGLRFCLLCP